MGRHRQSGGDCLGCFDGLRLNEAQISLRLRLRGSSAVKINKLAIFGAARHRCKRDGGVFALLQMPACPVLAHSGRASRANGCLLLGVKRT